MPDNDWWGVTITNAPIAQAPSGNYFYNLTIITDRRLRPSASRWRAA